MDLEEQIISGQLVCPKTKQKLLRTRDGAFLENASNTMRYAIYDKRVPVLLVDAKWAEEYTKESKQMVKEYDVNTLNKEKSLLDKIKLKLTQDYRTEASRIAFLSLFHDLSEDAICISIGGGPKRFHHRLLNINIGLFPNVDVVADAHCLPYSDSCVDAIHSDAVFEHLYDPVLAAKEIFRVLKPGGKAYISTPFLQAYHGYPHHYQNFTITGHKRLFEAVGLNIIESGSCVGPVYTVMNIVAVFLKEYVPRPLSKPMRILWWTLGVLVRPLDKIVGKKQNAYILSSTTYVFVKKPLSAI